jgi:maltose alpha-D-glucosyltransferase/alpha-amylase
MGRTHRKIFFMKIFLSDVLESYIIKQKWYGSKFSQLKYIELAEYFRIRQNEEVYYGLILEVNFTEVFYQHYFLPIAFVSDESFTKGDRIFPIRVQNQEGFIIDATNLEAFRRLVFERILIVLPNDKTRVQYNKSLLFSDIVYQSSRFMGLEQSNTSIVYNEKYVLKYFRRIYSDCNPDYEMSRFLSEKKDFKNTPAYLGSMEVEAHEGENITIALMQEMIPNTQDAWGYILKELNKVFLNLEHKHIAIDKLPQTQRYERLDMRGIPAQIIDWVDLNLFTKIQKLAKRTAEMHLALGSEFEDTAFTPTRFNNDYTVWLKNRLLYKFQNRINAVENNLHKLNGLALELANQFLEQKNTIRKRFVNFD